MPPCSDVLAANSRKSVSKHVFFSYDVKMLEKCQKKHTAELQNYARIVYAPIAACYRIDQPAVSRLFSQNF